MCEFNWKTCAAATFADLVLISYDLMKQARGIFESRNQRERKCLDFNALIKRFAHDSIISSYVRLLKQYRDNSGRLNRSIVWFLQQLRTVPLDARARAKEKEQKTITLGPMLFTAKFLATFDAINTDFSFDTSARCDARLAEVARFVESVTLDFISMLKDNPLLIVEALFTRSRSDQVSRGTGD